MLYGWDRDDCKLFCDERAQHTVDTDDVVEMDVKGRKLRPRINRLAAQVLAVVGRHKEFG